MKQKTPNMGADARARIAEALPVALEKAFTAYHDFIDGDNGGDHSDYKNKQTAAKAGLAHIELLIKLSNMVDVLDDDRAQDIVDLLSKAEAELEGK